MSMNFIYYEYHNRRSYGEIIINDENGEIVEKITLKINKYRFRGIYFAFKEHSDKKGVSWEERDY